VRDPAVEDLGIMPSVIVPSSSMASRSSADSCEITLPGSVVSFSRPSTLVRYTSFSALRASAIAPAAVSALML
jgi:hypothetical protein